MALFTLYQHLQVILKGGIGRAGSTVAVSKTHNINLKMLVPIVTQNVYVEV